MTPPRARRTTTARVAPSKPGDRHQAWLALVDTEGPFLAIPPLRRVWPEGMDRLGDAAKAALVEAKPVFDRAWDRWDAGVRSTEAAARRDAELAAYSAARDEWVTIVLRDVFGWEDSWAPGDALAHAHSVSSPDRRVSVTATGVMRGGDRIGALVLVVDPGGGLREAGDDGWAASPVDRMEALLSKADVPIGLVTDGRWWGLVSAPRDGMAASGIVDAQTWVEETGPRDALVTLLGYRSLVAGLEKDRLPALFAESVLAAEEITEALGVQVRRAVELVVAAFSESAIAARERGDADPLPDDGHAVYEAVVSVMMRVVFMLFAEKRDLLPQGQLYELGYGLSTQLDDLQRRAALEGDEALDNTYLTWHRLLATSGALHRGASFEDMRLPAYGGSLFDPNRFPFLTATTERGTLALTVSDRVMMHVLDAVQTARVKGQEARRISFRDIDVEQIGYIYEGLLGFTCRRATQVILGLIGTPGAEPEIPLTTLNDLYDESGDDAATAEAVIAWVRNDQHAAKPPSKAALTKAFASGDGMADADAVLLAVIQDPDLRAELKPWLGAIRRDLRGRPVVMDTGGLLVEETPSRRNAGAHYTPRALAEEVVLHALEPIVYSPGPYQTPERDKWRHKSSTELLELKVADIACGSGAFLVAAARYLSAQLLEAWHAEGRRGDAEVLRRKAVREVVAHCLYGADINGMAVEMCKLSLWLVSLDRDLPFSFVDDKILHGNSLLGLTSLKQLEGLHIDPKPAPLDLRWDIGAGNEMVERLDIDHRITRAIAIRRQLSSVIDDVDPMRSGAAKHAQMEQLADVTRDLRLIADGVVAAGLPLGGKPGTKLDEAYENLRHAVVRAFPADSATADASALERTIDKGLTPTVETDYERWEPLHWCLSVPDVMERGGFDALVGNPPFLGGKKISRACGSNMREWLVNQIAAGTPGNADLVAYFFLRAASILSSGGTLGLIATNTVAQGDTREVGLDRMIGAGFTITRSIQSRSWPATSANLEYAAVWGTGVPVNTLFLRVSDGSWCSGISSLLEPTGRESGHAEKLPENSEIAFIGVNVNGIGFSMEPAQAAAILRANPSERPVLSPYLIGDDVNSSPESQATRWIVDFRQLPEDEAREHRAAWNWVETNVKPDRLKLLHKPRLQERWWIHERPAAKMRRATSDLSEALVIALVSKTVMPVRVPTGQVFSHALGVFATDSYAQQAVLSSSLHQMWAIKYGSGMRNDPRYTPSDVFETFPRPNENADLDRLGSTLDTERREIMLRRQLGLTKLYNLVNDPDIADSADADVARMRVIHTELDMVVMAAYGWEDVSLDHGFHTYRQMTRWTVSPAARVEILDRLLEENHRRAALQGEAPKGAGDDAELDDDGGGQE